MWKTFNNLSLRNLRANVNDFRICQAAWLPQCQALGLDYLYFTRDTEQQARRAGDSGSPMLNIGACRRSVKGTAVGLVNRLDSRPSDTLRLITKKEKTLFPNYINMEGLT